MKPGEILEVARAVVTSESAAVSTLLGQLGDSFVQAAETMLACEGHVLCAGSGTSNAVAARLAHLLSCCGTPALFIHPGDSQHGLSGAVTARDVLCAISKGGETVEVNYLARTARDAGARIVGITEKPESTFGRMCDCVLKIEAPGDADPHGMIATGSSLVNSALCDALCVALLRMRGYTKEAFSRTHPGGAVGIKIREGT